MARVSTVAMRAYCSVLVPDRTLNELPFPPLGPDRLILLLCLADGILGRHGSGRRLSKHGVDDPGAVPVVDRGVGVAGIADVGRPVEGIGENGVFVGGLGLGVMLDKLGEVGDLLGEAGEVVVLAADERLPEVGDVVDEELLGTFDVFGKLP